MLDHDAPVPPASPVVSADSTRSTPPRKKRRWLPRWPWWLAAALLFGGLALLSLDELPPDVSDLIVEKISIPDEENSLVLLAKVAEDTAKAFTETSLNTHDLSEFNEGLLWDDKQVLIWTNHFEPFWERYQAAVAKPRSVEPRPTVLKGDSFVFTDFDQLAGLAVLRAQKLLHAGDPDSAIETALVTFRAGTRFQNSHAGQQTHSNGAWLHAIALHVIESAVRHPAVSKESLRAVLAEIGAAHLDINSQAGVMREERYFSELRRTSIVTAEPSIPKQPYLRSPVARVLLKIPGLYKPNKTSRLYNQHLRNSLKLINSGAVAQNAETERFYAEVFPPNLMRFHPDNIMGRVMLMFSVPMWEGTIFRFLRAQTDLSTCEAFVAARLYQIDHGALPATLDLLVPEYLSSVPVDYINNAPVRYSAALGVVWGAGKKALEITTADQVIETRETVIWFVDREPPPRQFNASGDDENPTEPVPANSTPQPDSATPAPIAASPASAVEPVVIPPTPAP